MSTQNETQNDTKTRTVTLTDHPPVRIREDQWPVVAHGWDSEHDGEVESQANRTWSANIRVRQHGDGRAIVYGTYDYDTRWAKERDVSARAGELLDPGADPIAAIRRVGETLTGAAGESRHIDEAVRRCIADLPAVEI